MATLEELEQQIDDLRALITTDYQPPGGVEYSYPVVNQPMSDEQWQYVTRGLGDGILDGGGHPYYLRNNGSVANTNATNQKLLTVSTVTGTAEGLLKGFYHRLMQDKPLTFDPVTSTTTYYVVLRYDPLGHKTAGGPIEATVVTSLNTNLGVHYCVLWALERKPNQLLSDAKITRFRPRVAPQITVARESDMPSPSDVLWGSTCVVHTTSRHFVAVGVEGEDPGPTRWKDLTATSFTWNRPEGVYKWVGHGAWPGGYVVGDQAFLEGRVARGDRFTGQNFNAGTDYQILDLPPELTPRVEHRFIVKTDGFDSGKSAMVYVSADGRVVARPNRDASWIGLDGIVYSLTR